MVSPATPPQPGRCPPHYVDAHADPPSYSLSGGSSSSSSAQSSPATLPLTPFPDAIVPAFPLSDRLADPLSPNSRHLEHLVQSALSLTLTKPSVQIVLAESPVFLSPPKRDAFGLSDSDYGIEGDENGKDARITGFVNVVAPHDKHIKGISLQLVGSHRLIFPPREGSSSQATNVVDEDFLVRELRLDGEDGKGITLEKGVNTWEFSFRLPSSCPPSDDSASGWTRYRIHSTVLGSGGLLKADLTVTKKVIVTCAPPREDSVHQLQVHIENVHPQLGPLAFDLSSNQFILSSPLVISLILAAPPPQLAIFCIQAYVVQSTYLTSLKDPTKTAVRKSAKHWIVRDGQVGAWMSKEFSAKARAKGPLLDGSQVGKDGKGLKEGEIWKWSKAGRLPGEEQQIAPTSQPGTETSLRYTNELFVEAVFNEVGYGTNDETVKIAPLFQRQVMIASCCCMLLQLRLPNYAAEAPPSIARPQRPDGCVACMCEMKWESLKADELALMRNGASGGTIVDDSIQERRRGGLCHRVEEFGGVAGVGEVSVPLKRGEAEVSGREDEDGDEEDGGGALKLRRGPGLAARKLGETF